MVGENHRRVSILYRLADEAVVDQQARHFNVELTRPYETINWRYSHSVKRAGFCDILQGCHLSRGWVDRPQKAIEVVTNRIEIEY